VYIDFCQEFAVAAGGSAVLASCRLRTAVYLPVVQLYVCVI
jgi:hypothetical protein